MRNIVLLASITLGISLFVSATVHAAAAPTPTCQPIFGGGKYTCSTGSLTVDKTVQDVQSGAFVQNLGVNDAHYSPESTVTFRIIVKNPGNDTIKNITIKDTFPKYLTYTSGEGKYDSGSRALTIPLGSLAGGKSQSYDIKAKVAKVQDLPQDQSVICLTNQALVKTADQTISDNAQFCIQRQASVGTSPLKTNTQPLTTTSTSKGGQIVYPVTTNQTITKTPPTGPPFSSSFLFSP
jgi:uncharacterized repeat protein (TIGR01451 family)